MTVYKEVHPDELPLFPSVTSPCLAIDLAILGAHPTSVQADIWEVANGHASSVVEVQDTDVRKTFLIIVLLLVHSLNGELRQGSIHGSVQLAMRSRRWINPASSCSLSTAASPKRRQATNLKMFESIAMDVVSTDRLCTRLRQK